jgi:hypothetical protein
LHEPQKSNISYNTIKRNKTLAAFTVPEPEVKEEAPAVAE